MTVEEFSASASAAAARRPSGVDAAGVTQAALAPADEAAFAGTLAAYDYPLDPECVAQRPASPRDAARMLVLPGAGLAEDRQFFELPQLLERGDLLVVNETRVLPARLAVVRPSGAPAELLAFAPVNGDVATATCWQALGRPAKGLRPGTVVHTRRGESLRMVAAGTTPLAAGQHGVVGAADDGALWVQADRPLVQVMEEEGELPLPPYVERAAGPLATDAAAYQTVFATLPGAVAAPTASLHFTERTYADLAARGVEVARLVLHVGPGTFLPIRREHAAQVADHRMHGEWYAVPEATATAVRAARAAGGRVVAAGTTSLRALETWAGTGRAEGVSRLFVRPGFAFRVTDALLTNFHLPRTTLLMLVAAFSGRRRILTAYAEAQRSGYRFFSYGDTSLLWAATPRRGPVAGEPGFVAKELF